MNMTLATRVKVAARQMGFDHCLLAPTGPAPHAAFYAGWLARGSRLADRTSRIRVVMSARSR